MDRGAPFALPTLYPWMRNLLIGLFALYVAELVLRNSGVDVYALAWHPIGSGFAIWQPLTRFLVQGPNVFGALMGLLLIYFLLPPLWATVETERLRDSLIAALVAGTLLPALLDLGFADRGLALGWTSLAWVWFPTVFGLALPNQTIYLMMLIPVNGRALLWLTAAFSFLNLLFGASGGHFEAGEPFGMWLGIFGWWNLLGPGARRRQLMKKASSIERELRKFQVIEGGRQGRGNRPPDEDEWVH